MKILRTIILINCLLLLSIASQNNAMKKDSIENGISQPRSSRPSPQSSPLDEVIEGDLIIVPNAAIYAKGMLISKSLKNQLKIQNKDMLIEVLAISEESNNWQAHGHPRLKIQEIPKFLPYKLLKGAKENDILTIPMDGKSLVFHLCQLKYKYNECGNFEDTLKQLKDQFVREPDYLFHHKESLLKKGVIVKNGSKIIHGPNSFKE